MNVGDIVKDNNPSYNDGIGVVVNKTGRKPSNVVVDELDKTVLELINSESYKNSEVVDIVFKNKLEYSVPNWWMKDKSALNEIVDDIGLKKYKYPKDMLSKISHGLINGTTIKIYAVADPINKSKGSYSFRIEDGKSTYTQSNIIKRYDNITAKLTYIEGLIEALSWIDSNKQVDGVQIVCSNDDIIRLLDKNADQSSNLSGSIDKFRSISQKYDKIDFRSVRSEEIEELNKICIKKYKSTEPDQYSFDVEKIVKNEYLVNGIHSVNLSHNTCTCEKDKLCEHIKYVKNNASKT